MRLGLRSCRRDLVIIVTPRFLPLLGGMERECGLLADAYARQGFAPLIVTEQLGMDLPRRETLGPVQVIRIPSSERRTLVVQLWVALAVAALLVRYRRRTAFAVVRTATLPAVVVGLVKRLRLVSFPTLMTAETGGERDDIVALASRPLFGLSRALVSAHDRLNGLCQANVDHLREFGFPEDRITMIPNGIDVSAWNRMRAPERVEHFVFLGRIEPAKGIYELLEAVAALRGEHPRIRLSIAGDGPSRADLERRSVDLGLDGVVRFLGRVDYDQLGELFSAVDCLVLPSYSEGMPLSVLEAAAHRRAIVATTVGDLPRLFADSAYLCRPRDAEDLRRALAEAMDDRPPRTGHDAVVADVDIQRVAGRLAASLGVQTPGGLGAGNGKR